MTPHAALLQAQRYNYRIPIIHAFGQGPGLAKSAESYLLENENNPAARAILGHFFFVHIHPYGNGNGRIGRFLMNVMMASGGYPWTIIPVSRRSEYMQSLEKASCDGDINSFMTFVQEVQKDRDEF